MCESLNVISTLVNGFMKPDSDLLLKSSGNKSLTAVSTWMIEVKLLRVWTSFG